MKVLSFILFTLLVSSCQSQKNDIQDLLLGNWSYCERNGKYVELHINDKTLDWCFEFEPFGVTYKYEIINDSIYIIDKLNPQKTLRSGKVNIIANNELQLLFEEKREKVDTINLKRISQEIIAFPNLKDSVNVKMYLLEYQERMFEKECKVKELKIKKSLGNLKL